MINTLATRRCRRCCLPFLILILLSAVASCEGENEVRLRNLTEFKAFTDNVNIAGASYSGTTVFLEADIDFSGKTLDPIGQGSTQYFKGIFDGQGHIIEGLKTSTTLQYSGIFGYSKGMVVRNVVVGQGSSFTNSYTGTGIEGACIGGITGYCTPSERPCIIENSVNMANISYDLTKTGGLFLGGIAGSFVGSSFEIAVRNCANYGSISFTGQADGLYLGGIVGNLRGNSPDSNRIQNCLNYGEVSNNGNPNNELHIGGIAGYCGYGVNIENCVNGGKISSTTSPSTSSERIGNIVGYLNLKTDNLTHSFWTGDTGYEDACVIGLGTVSDSSLITPNMTAVNNLNDYEFSTGGKGIWNRWLLNSNNKTVTFFINNTSPNSISISVSTQIILLPSTTVDSNNGFYWYTDVGKSELLESVAISEDTTLYGGVAANSFIVTFDFGNGTTTDKSFQYNSPIQYPVLSERDGYTFNGWTPKPDTMPSHDLVIIANWTEINSTELVEIVFGTKDLEKKDAEEIIARFTDDSFTIAKFERREETGEVRVIVKFTDKENAESFVTTINKSSEAESKVIKKVSFIYGDIKSFSHTLHTLALIVYLAF